MRRNMKTDRRKVRFDTVRRAVEPIRATGGYLSNVAFNMAQDKRLPADVRTQCKQWQKRWDEAARNLPVYLKRA